MWQRPHNLLCVSCSCDPAYWAFAAVLTEGPLDLGRPACLCHLEVTLHLTNVEAFRLWNYKIGKIQILLFYAIAIVFQLYLDGDLMHEMRRRKPEPTLTQTQGIFKLLQHMV